MPRNQSSGELSPRTFISSSTAGSVFSGWRDGSPNLGPATPEAERELSGPEWADSTGPYAYDNPADPSVSASAAGGQGFNALIGMLVLADGDDDRLGPRVREVGHPARPTRTR